MKSSNLLKEGSSVMHSSQSCEGKHKEKIIIFKKAIQLNKRVTFFCPVNWLTEILFKDVLYLQSKLKLQQLCVAGSSVTEEFSIFGVSLDGLAVMSHG